MIIDGLAGASEVIFGHWLVPPILLGAIAAGRVRRMAAPLALGLAFGAWSPAAVMPALPAALAGGAVAGLALAAGMRGAAAVAGGAVAVASGVVAGGGAAASGSFAAGFGFILGFAVAVAAAVATAALLARAPARAGVAGRLCAGWIAAGLALAAALEAAPPSRAAPAGVSGAAPAILAEALATLYAAYAETEEAAIYDGVAAAAEEPLAAALYLERRGALVADDVGETRFLGVRVEAFELAAPPTPDRIEAVATWLAAAELAHFGHVHERVGRFSAEVTLRRRADGWRLTRFRLRDAESAAAALDAR